MTIISYAFEIYFWLIIAYVFMSWVPSLRESGFGQVISRLVEPYLDLFRKIIPPLGMIDLSPIVAVLALYMVQIGLYTVLGFLLG